MFIISWVGGAKKPLAGNQLQQKPYLYILSISCTSAAVFCSKLNLCTAVATLSSSSYTGEDGTMSRSKVFPDIAISDPVPLKHINVHDEEYCRIISTHCQAYLACGIYISFSVITKFCFVAIVS